ncbi:MAG: tryptophan--tRNA ligase, partial [Firmicutes bacterium]|nr:tryptophan--tRNA ligase [Bacillota bacterium]
FGEARRMTQFKDKAQKNSENVNLALLNYPTLMAADILLYQADFVPVGKDQKQHIELARNLAERFNARYSDTFKVPEPLISKTGSARIMSLSAPESKMSKSDQDPGGAVFMLDSPEEIRRKFRRAVTDSENEIRVDKAKPGVTNLLTIYSAFADVTVEKAQKLFGGKGYGALKEGAAEAVIEALAPVQAEYARLIAAPDYLKSVLDAGAEKARRASGKTLHKVYRKIGFIL